MSDDSALTPREAMDAEKARLLEQAAAVDHDMAELERIVAKYKLVVVAPGSKAAPRQLIPRSSFERAQSEAESILRASGRPMWLEELFPMIINRGIELAGREPMSVLSAYLRRNKNVCFLREYGWWVADVPWPPGSSFSVSAKVIAHAEMNGADTFVAMKERNKENVARAIAAVRDFLKDRTEPMRLGLIYNHLISSGHTIPGKEPTMYLSQLLAKAGGLKNHGRIGWTLQGVRVTLPPPSPTTLRGRKHRLKLEEAAGSAA